MKKKSPELKTDDEAEAFVATSDLTAYDLSDGRMVRFEFRPKDERVNMRLPRPLLDAVRQAAAKAGIPYQRFIRQTLEAAVGTRDDPRRGDPRHGPNQDPPRTSVIASGATQSR